MPTLFFSFAGLNENTNSINGLPTFPEPLAKRLLEKMESNLNDSHEIVEIKPEYLKDIPMDLVSFYY